MKRPCRLAIVQLEDRHVPAGFGNAWIDTNLTVSFAPDGTKVDGVNSELFGALGTRMTTAEWQGAIKSAFQSWVAPANLNVGFVSDDGRAFGTPGPVQGSPYVGDIRISARPLSDNVLAISNPFDLISPWAGEIVINSNRVFDNDGSTGTYDLRTVLLQEVGHVLGVGNSADPNSVMYENYRTARTGLSSGDVTAVTALYGARTSDRYEGFMTNDALANATKLNFISSAVVLTSIDPVADATRYVAEGDLRTASDIDMYKLTLPKEKVTVLVHTGGLSQAQLKVAVLDSSGKELASTTTFNATRGHYRLTLTPDRVGDYYVSIRTATGTALDIGSYRLAAGSGLKAVPTSTLSTRVQNQFLGYDYAADWANGNGTNETLDKPHWLGADLGDMTSRWDFTGSAGIDAAVDADVFAVSTTWNSGRVLVASVWSETKGPAPVVEVYDQNRVLIPGVELVQNGSFTIVEIEGLQAWSTYYVKVQSAAPGEWTGREEYRFGFDFREMAVTLDTFAAGTLTQAQPQLARTLEVTRSQMFRFQLSATNAPEAPPTAARMTIFDAAGTAVFTMVAQNGRAEIGDVFLAPGTYRVVIVGATADGSPLKGLQIDARYMALTDPIGPMLMDEYTSESSTGTVVSGESENSSTSYSTGYIWLDEPTLGFGFLEMTDPYSSPWW